MGLAGHVARMGDRRGVDRVLVAGPEEKDNVKNRVIDGSIMLKYMFKLWDGNMD
jgi:hypothetical protein